MHANSYFYCVGQQMWLRSRYYSDSACSKLKTQTRHRTWRVSFFELYVDWIFLITDWVTLDPLLPYCLSDNGLFSLARRVVKWSHQCLRFPVYRVRVFLTTRRDLLLPCNSIVPSIRLISCFSVVTLTPSITLTDHDLVSSLCSNSHSSPILPPSHTGITLLIKQIDGKTDPYDCQSETHLNFWSGHK